MSVPVGRPFVGNGGLGGETAQHLPDDVYLQARFKALRGGGEPVIRRILVVAAFLLLIFAPAAQAARPCKYNGTCPTVTVTVPPDQGGTLPVTGGSDTNLELVRFAVAFVAVGGILVLAARKRTSRALAADVV
jgi:hypothetical protein